MSDDFLCYKPVFDFHAIEIIESANCVTAWELNDFTKELMGVEWVSKFSRWAEYNLPKQPACYMLGKHKMFVHPSIAQAIRDEVQERACNRIDWFTAHSGFRANNPLGFLNIPCGA